MGFVRPFATKRTRTAVATLLLSLAITAITSTTASAQTLAISRQSLSILSGQSLSSTYNTGDAPIIAIQIPSVWTAANLTFQTSWDGVSWADVYNMFGDEFQVVVGGPSRTIVMAPTEFQWHRYVRIRSGTSALPVTQGADRTLFVFTRRVP